MNQKVHTFASRVREELRSQKMSVADFAEELEKTTSHVYLIFGKYDDTKRPWKVPTEKIIVPWADALGVEPGMLTGDDGGE